MLGRLATMQLFRICAEFPTFMSFALEEIRIIPPSVLHSNLEAELEAV